MPKQKTWIALDLGGVLFDVHLQDYVRCAGQTFSVNEQQISAATFASALWQKAEIGELDAQSFAAQVLKQLKRESSPQNLQRWQDCWASVLHLRQGVTELLGKLKQPVAIWSNTDPVHARRLRELLDGASQHWLLSCELGVEKPDPDFYRQALQGMNSRAEQVYYFDDRQDNVDAARALGIRAHRVETLAQLQQQQQLGRLM